MSQHMFLLLRLLTIAILGIVGRSGFGQPPQSQVSIDEPSVIVLGIAQDAGYPQAGCRNDCCQVAWADPSRVRWPICLAIVDPKSQQRWMIECTPDFKHQLHALDQMVPPSAARIAENRLGLDGILITHAHIGHYAGLLNLGREVIGSRRVAVYAMPKMQAFLESSGPWDQLIQLENIRLENLAHDQPLKLNERLTVIPILVPHRGEYSETVAFRIVGPARSVLFLPDIDRWEAGELKIEEELARVDIAFLDATFFDGNELPGRDLSKIPHPLVQDSLQRFGRLPTAEKNKIHFLHFNHTNPLLDESSRAAREVQAAGFHLAKQLQVFGL